MFQIGNDYHITMADGDGTQSASWTVLEYNHPLIKLHNRYTGTRIVNAASSQFISAQLVDSSSSDLTTRSVE